MKLSHRKVLIFKMLEMKVYAKWKAVQITSALEAGEIPTAGMKISKKSH